MDDFFDVYLNIPDCSQLESLVSVKMVPLQHHKQETYNQEPWTSNKNLWLQGTFLLFSLEPRLCLLRTYIEICTLPTVLCIYFDVLLELTSLFFLLSVSCWSGTRNNGFWCKESHKAFIICLFAGRHWAVWKLLKLDKFIYSDTIKHLNLPKSMEK